MGLRPKKIYIALFLAFLLTTVGLFTPNKTTIIQIAVASNITYDRVAKTGEIAKDIHKVLKQDAMDIIQMLTKEDEPAGNTSK